MSANPDTDASDAANTSQVCPASSSSPRSCGALSLKWWKTRAVPAVGHAVFFGALAGHAGAVYICALVNAGPRDPRTAGLLVRGAVGGAALLTCGATLAHGIQLSV